MSILSRIGAYIHRNLVALDMFGNTLIGGKPDETISSRAQRASDAGNPLGKVVSAGLDMVQGDHGHKAMAGDLRRAKEIEAVESEALSSKRNPAQHEKL